MQQHLKNLVEAYKYAYKLKVEGKTLEEIKDELLRQGLDNKTAKIIADNIDKNYAELKAKSRKKNIERGVFWCLAGGVMILFTSFTHLHRSGYPYFLGCGTFLFGAIRIIRGFLK
ncbi:MAG TPA: hypothetical protein VG738_24725 [Chitinophagaceae bacterium]|nr:hypothetical protein [Chitinophagaceae bacterium]